MHITLAKQGQSLNERKSNKPNGILDKGFYGCNLSETDLSHSNLSNCNISCCNHSNANLSYCDLTGADLTFADLSGATLTGAILSKTILSNVMLTDIKLYSNAIFDRVNNISSAIITDQEFYNYIKSQKMNFLL